MTQEQMAQEIARLQQENASLKSGKRDRKITFKVSEKGCVSIMGLRRFPIALYPAEINSILDVQDELHDFIEANKGRLSMKNCEE